MAAITITRSLSDQGTTTYRDFISAFMPATFEFTFERGTATDTYVEVVFSGYTFRAVMIQQNYATNTDLYLMDLTSILPSWLGFAPMTYTVTGLTKSLSITINGKSSAGATLATASHTTQTVSFGYGDLGQDNIMAEIWYYGRKKDVTLYHNSGNISFYFNGSPSTYQINIAGVSYNYSLVTGYNTILLDITQSKLSGTLTITGQTQTFPIVYTPVVGIDTFHIVWINDSGGWDIFIFEKVLTNTVVESSNVVPIFNKTNYETKAKSVEINKKRSVLMTFRTVAKDLNHFKQLLKISESARIIENETGNILKVESAPSSFAGCRQNLNFTITLRKEENAISY